MAARRRPRSQTSSVQPTDEDFGIPPPAAEARANADQTDYEGTQLTVAYGREHIQPFRFQGFDVGPFEMTVTVQAGETPLQAKRRAMVHLVAMAEEEYREKLPRFQQRIRESGEV